MQKHGWFSVGLLMVAGTLVVLSCRLGTPERSRSGESVQIRFHSIPAHAVPPCASCHVEPGVNSVRVDPALCGACHEEDEAAQPGGQ
jgi:hypothetical protein